MTRVLPTGWEEKTLGEVCEINIGKTPSRADVSYWDKKKETNNIWLSIADLSNTTDKKVYSSKEFLSNKGAKIVPIVERGTLLLSFKLTIGRVAFAGVPLRTNEAIAQLPIKNANTLDKNYLYYYLQAYDYEELLQGDIKVKGKSLNKAKLKQLNVKFPSLPEQKRIVEKLDKIFANIDQAKEKTTQNLKNAQEVFNSVLSDIFNNPPENWEKKTIGEIASIKGGKRVPKGYKLVTHDTGYPYIRVTDFNNEGTVDLSDIHFIEEDVYKQISRYTISSKDLYISIAGTIGKSGIIPTKLEGANLTENACKLVLNKGVDQKFLYYFTLTTQFLSQSVEQTKVAGQPKLALSRLAGIKLSIPDISLQQQIAHKLDLLHDRTQNLEKIYTKTLTVLDELKQTVLQQAFSGKL